MVYVPIWMDEPECESVVCVFGAVLPADAPAAVPHALLPPSVFAHAQGAPWTIPRAVFQSISSVFAVYLPDISARNL